jgi:hypothetical protein
MKRAVVRLLGLYLLFAVIGRFVEGMGAVECGCAEGCWCRRPGLCTFRWVFPGGIDVRRTSRQLPRPPDRCPTWSLVSVHGVPSKR